jgi:co-chaperonin GroES (HSP10)
MRKQLQALHNYLHITPIQPPELKGVLFMPEHLRGVPRWGVVRSIGEGVFDSTGEQVKPQVEKGETVFFFSHGPEFIDLRNLDLDFEEINEGNNQAVFLSELDVLAVWESDTMRLKPLSSFIEIEPLSQPEIEKVLPSGLILPQTASEPNRNLARVKRLGMGLRTADGKQLPFHVKEGDLVLLRNHKYFECPLDLASGKEDDTTYLCLHGDIVAVYQDAE